MLAGGGVALLRSGKALDKVDPANDDQRVGVDIVRKALQAPVRQIAENAGVEGSVVVNRVRQMEVKTEGYDADKDTYGDLVAAGIIDPAKVVRTALQNASRVDVHVIDHPLVHRGVRGDLN